MVHAVGTCTPACTLHACRVDPTHACDMRPAATCSTTLLLPVPCHACLRFFFQQYSVVQLGLSCWRWKDSAWEAKSFNILTFDRLSKALKHNPVFGVQSSSFEFLSSQGFDFTRWVKDGASCVPLPARDKLLEEIRSKTFAGVIPGPAQVALGTLQTTGASVSSVANDPLRATIASFLRSSQQEIELPAADLKGLGQQLVRLVIPPCEGREG